MPIREGREKPKPKCKACNDTGKSSKGGPCYPCSLKSVNKGVKK